MLKTITKGDELCNHLDYPLTIRRLTEEESGGFFIEFRDLPSCMSDGDTIEEAMRNGEDAVKCWLAAAKATNHI